jgi:LysR family transcriptional regulator, chromosome initiation inhibitor
MEPQSIERLLPLDYKQLQALDAVVREQNFERAARALNLTQSAVSQRIKLLEQSVAQPLLIRTSPPVPTPLGQQLLGHYRQVSQLERELLPDLLLNVPQQPLKVSIAINADSLATWFLPALAPLLAQHPIELNLLIEDETRTLERLRQGEVFAAISTQQQSLPGCHASTLGRMTYHLVCSPAFARQYFNDGLTLTNLQLAPGVAFDQRDDMHVSYMREHFALHPGSYPCHTVRSSEAFIALARAGAAYCLIPGLQIERELASGELIALEAPPLFRDLYWHRWVLERGLHLKLSAAILQHGTATLLPLPSQE